MGLARTAIPLLSLALLPALPLAGLAAAPASSARHAKPAPAVSAEPRLTLPFIRDGYTRALAQARARKVPLFVEAWAPW
jgi:hypothetical protein